MMPTGPLPQALVPLRLLQNSEDSQCLAIEYSGLWDSRLPGTRFASNDRCSKSFSLTLPPAKSEPLILVPGRPTQFLSSNVTTKPDRPPLSVILRQDR